MNVVLTIVRTVADREDDDVTELPPLYDVVDPDVLQSFVESRTEAGATFQFTYSGYDVVVRDDGHVEVESRENPYRRQ